MKNEFRDLVTENPAEASMILLGIPYDKNASVGKGASYAPDTLRKLSYDLPALSMDGHDISSFKMYDEGNFVSKKGESCESYFARLQKKAEEVCSQGKFSFFLGGDHSISIATERGFIDYCRKVHKTPVVIHVDAHPDICEIYHDSLFSHACPNRRTLEYGLEEKNLTMIGMRGYELQEVEFFAKHPEVTVYNSTSFKENGYQAIAEAIIKKYKKPGNLIHLSYDIDANDPAYAPGTGTPEAFGPDSYSLMRLLRELFKELDIVSMDLVEIAPPLDINDITSWLGLKSLYEFIDEMLAKKKR